MIISLRLLLPLQGAHLLILLPRALALGYKLLPLRAYNLAAQHLKRNSMDNIREAPLQQTSNKIMIATEGHGVTRTTSVNIRETPMQKKTANKYCHSNEIVQMLAVCQWHFIEQRFSPLLSK